MDHKLRIILTFDFFEILTDLEFLISTVRLIHSLMQYGKKSIFEWFCSWLKGLDNRGWYWF